MRTLNYFLTAALCLVLTGLAGCSVQSEETGFVSSASDESVSAETPSYGDTAEEDSSDGSDTVQTAPETSNSAVINNGGTVVRIQGSDYYWKYRPESVASDGLFAHYSFQADSVNDMICRHEDGSEETVFSAAGNGSIYIAGSRMYLSSAGKMFSVNLDGSDRIDYDYFTVWDSNPESGLVIGSSGAAAGIQIISSETGAMETLADSEGSYPAYAGTFGDFVYFSAADPDSQELCLYQYTLDGSGTVREIDRFAMTDELFSAYSENVSVTQTAMLDNCLYYSYGFYAGTGGYFQTGGINCVKLDEKGSPVRHSVCVESISAEEFTVEKRGGEVFLYYITETPGSYMGFWDDYPYDGCTVKNLSSGETESSSFRLSRPGSFVLLDGAICTLEENRAAYKTLLSPELVSSLGCQENTGSSEDSLTIIRSLEIVDQDIYYTAETSRLDTSLDVGWRPGCRRTESRRFLLTFGQEEPQLLFSY